MAMAVDQLRRTETSHRPFQFSLLALFGWVTFAALMFWLSTFGVLGVILAIAVSKHVLVALLCMWHARQGRGRGSAPTAAERDAGASKVAV
jgi:predicted RND superfamily exporter protein